MAPGSAVCALRPQALDLLLHLAGAVGDGREELLLLGLDGGDRGLAGRGELQVGAAHHLAQHRHQLVQERLLEAQAHAVAHRAAEDAAQHVAAPLVAGDDAVGEQEGDRPQVVGDHPQRDVLLRVLAVGRAREVRGGGQDRLEEVGVVVRVHPWSTEVTRSRPMPVSIEGLGRGVSVPALSRSNCMKTRFQISR